MTTITKLCKSAGTAVLLILLTNATAFAGGEGSMTDFEAAQSKAVKAGKLNPHPRQLASTESKFPSETNQLQAHDINPEKNNYLVLSKKIQQLKPVLLTANELAKEDGGGYGGFYVIICGKTVNEIADNPDFNELLEKAKAQNVKVYVCGISLSKFNINPETLPSNLEITPNGILYGFQLAKAGFITLTI